MDKKFCKFCGEEIEKDAMVCPKCGRHEFEGVPMERLNNNL